MMKSVLVRLPEDLHAELSATSEALGVSMNSLISTFVRSGLSWLGGTSGGGKEMVPVSTAERDAAASPRRERTWSENDAEAFARYLLRLVDQLSRDGEW